MGWLVDCCLGGGRGGYFFFSVCGRGEGGEGAVRILIFCFFGTGLCGRGVTPFTFPYPLLFSNPS